MGTGGDHCGCMTSKTPSRGYAEAWLVESKTDITKKYTVSKRPDGTYACSCPYWKFHPSPKPICKHIDAVRDANNERIVPIPDSDRTATVRQSRMIEVRFDGIVVGTLNTEQAEKFKTSMRGIGAASPEFDAPKPPVTTFGDFTIRRKFRLGGE